MKKNFFKTICLAMVVAMVGVMMVGCKKDEYDFADDTISVVLEHDVSIEMVQESFIVTPEYFQGLQLSEVVHVSSWSEENVRKQLNGEQVENPINISTFRIRLRLKLLNPSHKTVLNYVDILNAREDVYGASVNGYGGIA